MRIQQLVTGIVISFIVSHGYSADNPDYFPLQCGNTWNYVNIHDSTMKKMTIEDSVVINEKRYYRWVSSVPTSSTADTIREDTAGNIWYYFAGKEYLWFDFSKADGERYTAVPEGFEVLDTFFFTVKREVPVVLPGRTFGHCIQVTTDIAGWMDAWETLTFAPEIGLVASALWCNGFSLASAVVNGKSYTATRTCNPPAVNRRSVTVTSRLHNGCMFFTYTIPDPQFIDCTLFSLAGQHVADVIKSVQSPGTHTVGVPARNLPGGRYIMKFRTVNFTKEVPFSMMPQ